MRRPGDIGWAGKAVLILDKDAPARGLLAAGFVDEGDRSFVGCKRLEDELTSLAAPDFNDVMQHRFVFFIPCTEWDVDPGYCNLSSTPGG